MDKDKVRAVLNHDFKRYGAKDASQADIHKTLMELGVIDGQRNRHGQRNQEAAYRFLPLATARQNFADARNLPVEKLAGQLSDRTDEESLVDLAVELDKAVQKYQAAANPPHNAKALDEASRTFRLAALEAVKQASREH